MKARKITTPHVPEPQGGIYSHCFAVGDQIFMAGQVGAGADAEAQSRDAFAKIRHLLEAADSRVEDIVKMTVYVTDIAARPAFGKVRAEVFPRTKPCSTFVVVKALATPDYLVEIDVTAVRGAGAGAA